MANRMIKIGSHMDNKAPDYVLGAVVNTVANGANALMIYTGAPQNTIRKNIEEFKIDEAKAYMKEHDIAASSLIIHAPYIINLANTEKKETFELGVVFLQKEIQRAEAIGASYMVLHPGSALKASHEEGIHKIAEGLNEVLTHEQSVMILLETMAGKGSEIGANFAELKAIYDLVICKEKIGVCMDTCHMHDAGYDVSDFDALLDEFAKYLPINLIKCIHVNDSKNACGAHKDRHENIGHGYIGFENLYKIVHNPRVEDVVKILETPYIEGKAPYKDEIAMLMNHEYVNIKEEQ